MVTKISKEELNENVLKELEKLCYDINVFIVSKPDIINWKSYLQFRCHTCNTVFKRSASYFRTKRHNCPTCTRRKIKKSKPVPLFNGPEDAYDKLKIAAAEYGCLVIDPMWTGLLTRYRLRCVACGSIKKIIGNELLRYKPIKICTAKCIVTLSGKPPAYYNVKINAFRKIPLRCLNSKKQYLRMDTELGIYNGNFDPLIVKCIDCGFEFRINHCCRIEKAKCPSCSPPLKPGKKKKNNGKT